MSLHTQKLITMSLRWLVRVLQGCQGDYTHECSITSRWGGWHLHIVDIDYAGDKVPLRLRSSLLIFMNTAFVQWFSTKQSTVETSVFGTEFVTWKQGIAALRGLRYKLRMMGFLNWGFRWDHGEYNWPSISCQF